MTAPTLLGSVLLGLAAVAACWALVAPGDHRRSRALSRRIGATSVPSASVPEPPAGPLSRPLAGVRRVARSGDRLDRTGRLGAALDAADLPVSAGEAIALAVGAPLVVGLLLALSVGALAGIVGSILALSGLTTIPARRRSRRRREFADMLPDTLDLVIGALSAGQAITVAIDTAARESRGVVAQEWGRAAAEHRWGRALDEALTRAAERMSCPDLAWVAVVIGVHREVGGSLGAVLSTTVATLRQRDRQRRHTRALTAEARLSAIILCGLPVAFAAFLAVVRPEYLWALASAPWGLSLSAGAALLLSVGVLWMRALTRGVAA